MEIFGSPEFGFNAHHQPVEAFDPGLQKAQRHPTDIKKEPFVYLNVDYKQMGVGGDDSWGAKTHDKYMIFPGDYNYSYTLKPLSRKTNAR